MTSPQNTGPDFDERAASFAEWVKSNSRMVGIGAVAIGAMILVTMLVRSSNQRKEIAATRALAEAQRSVATDNLPLAAADLQRLVERYGSTRAGTQGKVLLAQVLLQQGKTAEAHATLDDVGGAGPLTSSVHALRAAAFEQEGKPLEAAAEYMRASETNVLEGEAESHKADAARAYLKAERRDEAVRIWSEMAADPTSGLYAEAQLRLGELTAKPRS
ncbi:MAG: tetratricopeptide repeat protein [Gemmatimonadota bacterium]